MSLRSRRAASSPAAHPDANHGGRHDHVYHGVIRLFRGAFRAFDLRFDVQGAEHIPATGPAVLACNHTGYLDFTFVGLAASYRDRLVRFMAKQSTFANPVSGPLMRRMHHIPVDRDDVLAGAVAYRRAIRELEAGELVGVFPEATISRSWQLREFKPGAAALATRQQVPLLPVIAWGGHRIASTDGHVHPRQRHVPVTVAVGAPIPPDPARDRHDTQSLLRDRMTDLLDRVQRSYPVDGTGQWWAPRHLGGAAPSFEQACVREQQVDDARRAKREHKAAAR